MQAYEMSHPRETLHVHPNLMVGILGFAKWAWGMDSVAYNRKQHRFVDPNLELWSVDAARSKNNMRSTCISKHFLEITGIIIIQKNRENKNYFPLFFLLIFFLGKR